MELPLFKGISEEQVSLFLEKTCVDFLNYEEDAVIAEPDDRVKGLKFILTGSVKLLHSLKKHALILEETLNKGNVIGALNLYGLKTNYGCRIISKDKVSLMKISKEHYMNLLQSNPIYLINYLNLLSAASQRPVISMISSGNYSIEERISELVRSVCSPFSHEISIYGELKSLANFCGVSEITINEWTHSVKNKIGLIKLDSDKFIIKLEDNFKFRL